MFKKESISRVASIFCHTKHFLVAIAGACRTEDQYWLAILSYYYCVLLRVLDGKWWVHGWADKVWQDGVE
jgi:hypothetical protein